MLSRLVATAIVIPFCCLTPVLVDAQNDGTLTGHHSRPAAEELRVRGIDLSRKSLISALSNGDSQIRVLAANQLAHNRDSDAVPSIEEALSTEKQPEAQIGIAVALWVLNDPKGVEQLHAMCRDPSLPVTFVIRAVQALENTHSSTADCAEIVLSSLRKQDNAYYVADILTLLPSLQHDVSLERSLEIVRSLENLLNDQRRQVAVRLQAGHALAEIGSPSSSEVIRQALLREPDPVIRACYQEDLDTLRRKKVGP